MERLKCNEGFVVLFVSCLSICCHPRFHAFSGSWIMSWLHQESTPPICYIGEINWVCELWCEWDWAQYLFMAPELVHRAWNLSNNYMVEVEAGAVLMCCWLKSIITSLILLYPLLLIVAYISMTERKSIFHLYCTFFKSLKIGNSALIHNKYPFS